MCVCPACRPATGSPLQGGSLPERRAGGLVPSPPGRRGTRAGWQGTVTAKQQKLYLPAALPPGYPEAAGFPLCPWRGHCLPEYKTRKTDHAIHVARDAACGTQ